MSDQLLLTLLNKAPPGAVLLLEDIDTVACARNRDGAQASGTYCNVVSSQFHLIVQQDNQEGGKHACLFLDY